MAVKGLVHSFIFFFFKKKRLISYKWSIKSPQHCYHTDMFYFHYILVFETFMYCNKSIMIFLHGGSAVKGATGSYIFLIIWEQRLAFTECSNIEWPCYTATERHRAPQKTSSLPNEKQPHMDRSVLEICRWQSHIFGSFMSRDSVLHPKLSSQITPILHKKLIYKVFWAFLQKRLNQSEKKHLSQKSLIWIQTSFGVTHWELPFICYVTCRFICNSGFTQVIYLYVFITSTNSFFTNDAAVGAVAQAQWNIVRFWERTEIP